MLHSGRFTAILDANVLYPAPLRDLLLSLADHEMYIPKWSPIIEEEWTRNVLSDRTDLSQKKIARTAGIMNAAFPDAMIEGFEPLIIGLELPDPGDNHVLAAAIRSNAEVIVTSNLKDFPQDYLDQFDVEAQSPDTFITNLIDLNQATAIRALQEQVQRLRNPPCEIHDVLDAFRQNGLKESADYFAALL